MSYILDALRKADAERDRGNVPGIHAQPSFGGGVPSGTQPAAKPWLWLAGGAAAVCVVGALAWYVLAPPRAAVEVAAPAPAPAPAATTPPPVAAAPAPVMPTPAAPPAIAAKAQATPPAIARKPKAAAAPSAAASTTEAKPAAAGEKVYTVAELPDDIRRQLPNLTIGGSMYSSNPPDRILIINGQVLHEGDSVAPDLTLQQIRLKGALLNFKGYRYAVAF